PSVVPTITGKVSDGKSENLGASVPLQHQPIHLDPQAIANKDIVSRLEKIEKILSYRRNRGRQRNRNQTQNMQNQDQNQQNQNQNTPNQQNQNQTERKEFKSKDQEQQKKSGNLNQ
ncbi:MAG: hypothetical protein N0E48_04095, partial [Candidatus Thiodiazotropha endolucinida]|nr:hypothetical protein [Candidatus Thiodiazotropha taylori]MCW4342531.1 hypothetical protein [Candidatus Thiodiazotropha endolucinida]